MPNQITKIEVRVEIEKNKTQMIRRMIDTFQKQLSQIAFKDVNIVSIKKQNDYSLDDFSFAYFINLCADFDKDVSTGVPYEFPFSLLVV